MRVPRLIRRSIARCECCASNLGKQWYGRDRKAEERVKRVTRVGEDLELGRFERRRRN